MHFESHLLVAVLLSIVQTLSIVHHHPANGAGNIEVSPEQYHKVAFVYDGDTVLLDSGEKVRLLGINCPEMDHSGEDSEFKAAAAQYFTRERVKGTRVWLEQASEKHDRYDRLLAYVFLEDGGMLNLLLVREGLAHVMFDGKNMRYRSLLLDSQRKAMKAKRGIWRRPVGGNEKIYLGNKNSLRFHRPDCPFGKRTSKKNQVRIKTRRQAFWEGFSPCKQCCP
jgi:endonuclease YncB( thermonuclease family)